jgi:hypothetical protein
VSSRSSDGSPCPGCANASRALSSASRAGPIPSSGPSLAKPTRPLAALVGVVTSALALAGLIVSYGREGGLLGWPEAGFRTAIVLAVVSELAAVVLLSTGLAATTASPTDPARSTSRAHGDHHARDVELRHPFPWLRTRSRTTV